MSVLRRSAVLAAVLITLVAAPAGPAAATGSAGPPPSSIASLGDSITRGFNACGWFVDCTARSFATGTSTAVNSHYLRIRAVNPAIAGHAFNDARSGAKVAALAGQADAAVAQGASYVTILIGANDACAGTEAAMTGVAAFRAAVDAGLARLKAGLPQSRILVVSIPDLRRLWQAGHNNPSAVAVWSLFRTCQSMLANPTSLAAADVARRARVRQRVVDYNGELAAACAAYGPTCRFDGNAVFDYPFSLAQVSAWDYFHPNRAGQQVLARISYAAGFNW